MPLTISLVQYLNSAPLGWGFLRGQLGVGSKVILSTPAECADQMQQGMVDVGLIPVVEYQRIPDLAIIPNISIATQGRTRSVLLVSSVEIHRIRTVALDVSSRTSAVLVQILLSQILEIPPSYETCEPDVGVMLAGHDAALIIGDFALEFSRDGCFVYDLGELWVCHTGLPFVFAFWAVRPSDETMHQMSLFEQSRRYGLNRLDEICDEYSQRLSLSPAEIYEYLTVNIDFDLGTRHVEGLELFLTLAVKQGLLDASWPLKFLGGELG